MGATSVQIINRVVNAAPVGAKDGVNLEFTAPDKFDPKSLEVFLSGINLEPITDFVIQPDNKTFEIVLEPNDGGRLNCPPQKDEPFRINYVQC